MDCRATWCLLEGLRRSASTLNSALLRDVQSPPQVCPRRGHHPGSHQAQARTTAQVGTAQRHGSSRHGSGGQLAEIQIVLHLSLQVQEIREQFTNHGNLVPGRLPGHSFPAGRPECRKGESRVLRDRQSTCSDRCECFAASQDSTRRSSRRDSSPSSNGRTLWNSTCSGFSNVRQFQRGWHHVLQVDRFIDASVAATFGPTTMKGTRTL